MLVNIYTYTLLNSSLKSDGKLTLNALCVRSVGAFSPIGAQVWEVAMTTKKPPAAPTHTGVTLPLYPTHPHG